MTAGQPTKCTPEVVAKARHYTSNYDIEEYGHVIPSLVGLAKITGLRRETFYLWAKFDGDKDDPRTEFKDIIDTINEMQEFALLQNGLTGVFNSTITKLALANHGYHDKQDSNVRAAFTVNIGDKDAETL